MAKQTFEDKAISQIEFKKGILDTEGNNPMVAALAKIQAEWRKIAVENQKQVAIEHFSIKEMDKDEQLALAVEEKRYQARQFEYQEKLMAAVELMYLFEKSSAEAEKGVQITPLCRYDQLKQKADFVLSVPDENETNLGLAISVNNALSDSAAKNLADNFIAAIRAGKFEVAGFPREGHEYDIDSEFKYIPDDDLRGQVMPRIQLFINNGSIEKMATAIMASKNKTDLTEAEKDLKVKIRLEIEKQVFALQGALRDFVDKAALGIEPAKLAKAKEMLAKVSNFYENFKK
ncbi:MAG: hypothetical protein NTX82_04990 [Candidatus Parcubacteria bacterium]|nr:hypothetical protein [Candidatus Parcubacteria bacterium]